METKSISTIIMFMFFALTVLSANKTEKLKVNGKCDMCKNRIETATKSVEGVKSASWDKSTKSLTVNYDDNKTTSPIILTSIAMAGHDNEMFGASDSGYNELPGCCQYKRDINRKKNMHGSAEIISKKSEKAGSCCDSKQ